ncbi:MAG: hypothetical protein D084_Lepto4C00437G0004 [Leptospirillum sp. Group IV 'UBA BS']|jgi:hypothetical protein|nr:MAG: hypothetical protein D084_Lepto4C00437G0004 [Leptospirillum sp. Group IV 'UBA BS']
MSTKISGMTFVVHNNRVHGHLWKQNNVFHAKTRISVKSSIDLEFELKTSLPPSQDQIDKI